MASGPAVSRRGMVSMVAAAVVASWTAGAPVRAQEGGDQPWPVPVPGFVPPAPGEHPRLFFRKSDVPALRQRAATPEGQQIIARCKQLLDGAEAVREPGKFTLWDAAAFGFLYQVTGDKKYADLARQCVDKIWAGAIDKDDRYSLVPPNEPMRAGPSLSAVAMAYDLCYDAWDEAYRTEQAQKMMTWTGRCKKRGGEMSLERLAMSPDCPNPVTNHYGLQVGGAGLTLLALQGDPGVDAEKIKTWMAGQEKGARKVFTEDFGEGGYFGEHAGPGVIAMTWTMTPWILAERVAGGRDWLANPAHPTPEWMSLKFVLQTVPTDRGPMYTNPSPGRGGYGGDQLEQNGGHHSTYFVQGFGAIQPFRKPAMLWVYQNFVEPYELQQYADSLSENIKSYDCFSYPHRPMFALVNWPIGVAAQNPEATVPKAWLDRFYGQAVFRNQWKDKDDIVVAVLFGARTSDKLRRMMVWGLGQQLTFGEVTPVIQGSGKIGRAKLDHYQGAADGSGVVAAGGQVIAVDYSRASGADAVVVMAGPGANGRLGGNVDEKKSKVQSAKAGDTELSILTLSASGAHPEAKSAGDKVELGGQTIAFTDGKIVFGKMAGPWPGPKAGGSTGATAGLAPAAAGPGAAAPAGAGGAGKPASRPAAGAEDAKMLTNRLNAAKSYLKGGNKVDGLRILRELVRTSPDSPQGQEAAKLLEQVGK